MSSSSHVDGQYLSPPPHLSSSSSSSTTPSSQHHHQQRQRTPRRGSSSDYVGGPRIIVIDPTPEQQQFYNKCRRAIDQQLLQQHVARENSLAPPPRQADLMSLSTTSDGQPSPSTIPSQYGACSSPNSPNPPSMGEPGTGTIRHHAQRGRRKGPLSTESRPRTAFKRRFKLTCEFHRQKRTSCNCHDFSKLEEGYKLYLAEEAEARDDTPRSRACSVGRTETTYGGSGDIRTFGTGGAAPPTNSSYQDLGDLNELSCAPPATGIRPGIQPIMQFDIDSETSVNEIVNASLSQLSYPWTSAATYPQVTTSGRRQGVFGDVRATATATRPLPVPITRNEPCLLLIGSQMKFNNRWCCEYKYPAQDAVPTSTSLTSASTSTPISLSRNGDRSCSWTGPIQQLADHFATSHYPFEPATEPKWSWCSHCNAISSDWDAPECIREGRCASAYLNRWYFGAINREIPINDEYEQKNVPTEDREQHARGDGFSWGNATWGGSAGSESNLANEQNYSLGESAYNEYSGPNVAMGSYGASADSAGQQGGGESGLICALGEDQRHDGRTERKDTIENRLESLTSLPLSSCCLSNPCGYGRGCRLTLNPFKANLTAQGGPPVWQIALSLMVPGTIFVLLERGVCCRLWCLLAAIVLGFFLPVSVRRARDLEMGESDGRNLVLS